MALTAANMHVPGSSYVERIYPVTVGKSIGIRMTRAQAITIATMLLAAAHESATIDLTGSRTTLTVLVGTHDKKETHP